MGVRSVYQGANNMRMRIRIIQCRYTDLRDGKAQWISMMWFMDYMDGEASVCQLAIEMRMGT